MVIRKVREDDAKAFLAMLIQLDNETKFMLYEPGERKSDINKIKSIISDGIQTSFMYVVEDGKRLVGFLSGQRGHTNRIKHSAYIVIGIINNYRGKGIGKELFSKLNDWAKINGIKRLELTVMAHNERAIKLYKKMGYKVEGIKEKSIKLDGQFIDEYYMAKII